MPIIIVGNPQHDLYVWRQYTPGTGSAKRENRFLLKGDYIVRGDDPKSGYDNEFIGNVDGVEMVVCRHFIKDRWGDWYVPTGGSGTYKIENFSFYDFLEKQNGQDKIYVQAGSVFGSFDWDDEIKGYKSLYQQSEPGWYKPQGLYLCVKNGNKYVVSTRNFEQEL